MLKFVFVCVAVLISTQAEARHHHSHHRHHHVKQQVVQQPSFFSWFQQPTIQYQPAARVSSEIVAHPSGCPSRAFCGCGAAVHLFGRSVQSLWLAANWYRFPRANPAPRMAAVRPHHVFVLEQHIQGNIWLVYDANSGGHATRLHARSISGYTIVNPLS